MAIDPLDVAEVMAAEVEYLLAIGAIGAPVEGDVDDRPLRALPRRLRGPRARVATPARRAAPSTRCDRSRTR